MNNEKKYTGFLIIIGIIVIAIIATNRFQHLNQNEEPIITNIEAPIDTYIEESGDKENGSHLETELQKPKSDIKIYFFDVGQGDSIFVQTSDNCMLIDAGNNPDGKYISKLLRNKLNIQKIDYLIGTHAHEDHIGGIDIILEDIDVGKFYMPNSTATNKTYTDVLNWAKKKNVDIVSPSVGTMFSLGEATCEVMSIENNREEENENSIVIELTFGTKKFLFTADMEVANEESRAWDDVDVLKVAHHGSTYTSSKSFLKEVKPEIAVITCGKNNDYYYPHEAVLKRLKEVGCEDIIVTADEGTILMTSDGVSITTEKMPDLSFDGNM